MALPKSEQFQNQKQKDENDPILYYITNEELYSKIEEIHTAQGHDGINNKKKKSDSILQPLNIGDNVRVPITEVVLIHLTCLELQIYISQGKYDIGTTVGHLERTLCLD